MTITGIEDKEGDLAFDKDGTLYLCTSSEVYKLQLNLLTNKYDNTKTNGLDAFNPTSMTF
jgi:hypothetical protein